jgi:hypothetical protein
MAAIAAMSAPAQKAFSPAPVTSSARMPASRRTSRSARASSRSVTASSAFRAFGRSSRIVATAPERSRCRLAKDGSGMRGSTGDV